MPDLVDYAVSDGIATLTMDDGKANVMSIAMLQALDAGLDRAERDEATVVVVSGREGIFSGGFDRGVFSRPAEEIFDTLRHGGNLVHRLMAFPVPVLAACTGHAIAQGAFTVLAADSSIGTRGDYKIGLNEVAIGLTIPWYAIEVSRNRLAPAWFNHCSTTGVLISPDEALAAGFFDRLVDPADHSAAVAEEAERLAGLDRTAHAATKLRIREAAITAVREGVDREFPEPD